MKLISNTSTDVGRVVLVEGQVATVTAERKRGGLVFPPRGKPTPANCYYWSGPIEELTLYFPDTREYRTVSIEWFKEHHE